MSTRYFSADFHLGMTSIIRLENRPFRDIREMDSHLISECTGVAKSGDVIMHLGDLASYGMDRSVEKNGLDCTGLSEKPDMLLKPIRDNGISFLNIRGNHDMSNRVESFANSAQISLGRRFPQVVCGHYPSYDRHSVSYRKNGWITLCGHVHGKWKYCLDLDRQSLNVNCGCDVWGYRPVSETELADYVSRLIQHKPYDLFRCRFENGKLTFYGNPNAVI